MMSLYHYFKLADNVLPSPTAHLSSSISPMMIKGHGQQLAQNANIKTAKSFLKVKWDCCENFDQRKFPAIRYVRT